MASAHFYIPIRDLQKVNEILSGDRYFRANLDLPVSSTIEVDGTDLIEELERTLICNEIEYSILELEL